MSFPISFPLSRLKSPQPGLVSYWLLLLFGSILGIGAAYLLVLGQWQMALGLIFILPAVILILRYPFFSVMVWLLLGPFLTSPTTAAERMVYWMIHRALPPATVGLILLSYFLRIRKLPKLSPAEVAMVGYVVLTLSSIALFNRTPQSTTYSFYDKVFSPMCLYFIVRFAMPKEKDLHRLVPIIFFLGISQAVIGILSWFAPQVLPHKWQFEWDFRTVGSLRSYSVYSTTMIFAGLFILQAALNRKPGLVRTIFILFFFLSAFSVFITFSRGSWLAGIVVFLGLITIYPKMMFRWIVIAVPAAILLVGFAFTDLANFASQRLNSRDSALHRLTNVVAALRMFETKPIFGWGYRNYGYYDREFQARVGDLINADRDSASHNNYLTILAEQGIVGLSLFLAPVAWWLVETIKTKRKIPAEGFWSWKLLILLWLVLLNHFINNNFVQMWVGFGLGMWWLTLGLIANLISKSSANV